MGTHCFILFYTKNRKGIASLFILMLFVLLSACKEQKQIPIQQEIPIESNTTTKDSVVKANLPVNFPFLEPSIDDQISPFVRRIFQDKKDHFWFGTNGDGVARYNGHTLEYFSINNGLGGSAVRGIVEDNTGNIWF
ncbi:MAG: hypothetical protein KBT69_04815, partial [Oceanihabitans sp.]|nr:hypothetical protein [Oceanihabitans sp.]